MDNNNFINLCENMCPSIKGQINYKILPHLKKYIQKYFKIIDNPLDLYNIKPGDKYLFSKFCLKFYKQEDITKSNLYTEINHHENYKNISNACRLKINMRHIFIKLNKTKYLLTISHYVKGKEEIDAFTLAYPKNENDLYISVTCARTYNNINPSFGLLLRCILLKYAYENGYKNIYNKTAGKDLVNYYSIWGFRVYDDSENCNKKKSLSRYHSKLLKKNDLTELENFYIKNIRKNVIPMRICHKDLNDNIQKIYNYTSQKLISIWNKLNSIDTDITAYHKYIKYISENYDMNQIKNIDFNLLSKNEKKNILNYLKRKYGDDNVQNILPNEFKYLFNYVF